MRHKLSEALLVGETWLFLVRMLQFTCVYRLIDTDMEAASKNGAALHFDSASATAIAPGAQLGDRAQGMPCPRKSLRAGSSPGAPLHALPSSSSCTGTIAEGLPG